MPACEPAVFGADSQAPRPFPRGLCAVGACTRNLLRPIGLLPCAPSDCDKKRRAGSLHIITFKGPVRARTHAYGGCPCSSRTRPADVRCKLSVDFPRSVARSAQSACWWHISLVAPRPMTHAADSCSGSSVAMGTLSSRKRSEHCKPNAPMCTQTLMMRPRQRHQLHASPAAGDSRLRADLLLPNKLNDLLLQLGAER